MILSGFPEEELQHRELRLSQETTQWGNGQVGADRKHSGQALPDAIICPGALAALMPSYHRYPNPPVPPGPSHHLLVFQMCRVSGSEMPLFSACSSRKSKKYLTASGGLSSRILRIALNRSSRNFCSVPCREDGRH